MSEHKPITAEFVNYKPLPKRSTFQLIFEVPIETADKVIEALGGTPLPGQTRVCAIVLMDESA